MDIKRELKAKITKELGSGKIIILYGARQVGKTTLVKEILKDIPQGTYLSCDEPDVLSAFTNKTSTEMKVFIGSAKTLILDEAQRVTNIGLSLKLLHDTYPNLTIIATGSSSFDLANKVNEPLTGRNVSLTLYPVLYKEFSDTFGALEAKRLLEHRIIHGMYPSVVNAADPQKEIKLLAKDYLFKDVLRIESIRKPIIIEKLTQLLAFQIGQEVSYNEIAQKLEISRNTVMRYVRLLEQAFIIFRLPPLGRNPRNEITRFEKIYFYDTGIRNALIGNFDAMESRMDRGQLFENFCIAERIKYCDTLGVDAKHFFWRTKDGSEVDLIETVRPNMKAFECKWGRGGAATRAWNRAYPDVAVELVTKDTATSFLGASI